MINPKVEFINHASVLITYGNVGLLSDPWYQGDAFHKGWNLLHEFDDNEINILLDRTSHIWISHEHPDHFSISFFKKFGKKIIDKEIEIIEAELVNSGKPKEMASKISKGKISKFINDNSLLNQVWIMDPKKKVSDILKENKVDKDIKILDFIRYKVGEGV